MRLDELPGPGGFMVNGYGDGGFRISGKRHAGSVIILPDQLHGLAASDVADLSADVLSPVIHADPSIEVLLIGCGADMRMISVDLRRTLENDHRLGVDVMNTGAACRTYNLLRIDGRAVAAALIAV